MEVIPGGHPAQHSSAVHHRPRANHLPEKEALVSGATLKRASPLVIYEDSHSFSSASPLSQRSISTTGYSYHNNSTASNSYHNSSTATSTSSPSPYSDIQSFIHSYTDSCSGLFSDSLTASSVSYMTSEKRGAEEDKQEASRRSIRVSPIKSQDSGYSDSEEGVTGNRSQDFVSRVFVSSAVAPTPPLPASVTSSPRTRVAHVAKTLSVAAASSEECRVTSSTGGVPPAVNADDLSTPGRKVKTCRKCLHMARKLEKIPSSTPTQDSEDRWVSTPPSDRDNDKAGELEGSAPVQTAEAASGGGLSRCPVAHWLSELPSLYEPECTNMLQSKAILAEVSLSSLIMENLRRVQSQGLQVTRLFATICRSARSSIQYTYCTVLETALAVLS